MRRVTAGRAGLVNQVDLSLDGWYADGMRPLVSLLLVLSIAGTGCFAGTREGKTAAIAVNLAVGVAGGVIIASSSSCTDDESCHGGGFSGAAGGSRTGAVLLVAGLLAAVVNFATMPPEEPPQP